MDNLLFPINESRTYYIVNGQKVYSKFKAFELAGGDASKIHFYWMEDVWQSVDWTKRPSSTWLELLKKRCQQIRDKYDYVAVWYSSGYDSHTILRSFVDNNILIDEILITDRTEFFDDPEVPVAIQHAQLVKDRYFPNLKINVVKVKAETQFNFYKSFGDQWIYHPGRSTKFSKTNRYYCQNLAEEYLTAKKQTERFSRGDVLGFDKARVLLREGKWYAFLPDDVMNDIVGNNAENFYYSSEMPEMNVMQCHMVIDWFESLPELTEELVHKIQGSDRKEIFLKYYQSWAEAGGRFPLNFSHHTSRDGSHKIFHIQDETSPDSIKLLKHFEMSDPRGYEIYQQGAKKIFDIIDPAGSRKNRTIISKQYYIRDLKHPTLGQDQFDSEG